MGFKLPVNRNGHVLYEIPVRVIDLAARAFGIDEIVVVRNGAGDACLRVVEAQNRVNEPRIPVLFHRFDTGNPDIGLLAGWHLVQEEAEAIDTGIVELSDRCRLKDVPPLAVVNPLAAWNLDRTLLTSDKSGRINMKNMLHIMLVVAGMLGADGAVAENIPFPGALQDANVSLSSMRDGQTESLMLGNGDLYGIVWDNDGSLFMRVTKNDIWDARVDTSKDGPPPRVNVSTGEVIASRGAPPSYKHPYPHPRCAAAIRFGDRNSASGDRAVALPNALPQTKGTLDILQALATIERNKPAEIRILSDRNVVLIRSEEAVRLEAITSPLIPAAVTGVRGEVAWLHQKLPGDAGGDWAGMEYALAVATRGNLKAVSLVSSYDLKTGDVLASAIKLAEKTIRCKESQLIKTHEAHWSRFWAQSGIQLADKDLQRWWYRMLYFAKTVCKPGAAPVALMPPLATDETPWHADYHHNYNAWHVHAGDDRTDWASQRTLATKRG